MKKLIYTKLVVAILIVVNLSAYSQVKTKIFEAGVPNTLIPAKDIPRNERSITAPVEFEKLKNLVKTGKEVTTDYKYSFALPVNVDIDVLTAAKVIEKDSLIVYVLTIKAYSALNVSVHFNEFYLSPNALLSIYTNHELTDSITAKENNQNKVWATRVYQGNTMNIVLKVPLKEKGFSALRINQINFGYRKFGNDFFGNPGTSAPCNRNVVCPEGTGWENERNSVALIVSGGVTSCTGALIMNTCNTNIPYLLTAEHCLDANVQNWVFQFQTWSTTCIGDNGWREDVQFNGCQLRANNGATDFALLELNQIPPTNSGIFYAGWSRDANPATSATGIHHPSGDLMKISRDIDPVISVTYPGSGGNNHWRATFDQGIVQHGSSGSSLFDQNHRVVGQLHGNQNNTCAIGDNNCFCNQLPVGEYGRFDISWTGGGTNATRLSNWLDPTNSGALTTNTTNISLLTNSGTYYIAGDNTVCATSNDYIITNLPAGANVQWQASPSGIVTINSPNSTQTTLTKNSSGNITLTAIITNTCGGPTTVTKEVRVGGYSSSDYQISGPSIACNNQEVYFSITPTLIGATGYAWFWPSDWTYIAGNNSNYLTLRTGTSSGVVGVRVANACDAGGSPATKYVQVNNCGYGFTASPNPTNNTLTVQAVDGKGQPSKDPAQKFYELQITDKSGVIKKQFKYAGGLQQTSINLSPLPANLYFLRVWDGKAWTSLQIFKQ